MIEITQVLSELSRNRPIFHSEADFQHALAWRIHQRHPDLTIRLEKRLVSNVKDIHVDIFILKDQPIIAEVKYRTKDLHTVVENEEFLLKDQSAPDAGRYEFIKDISRIENALENHPNSSGMAIFLTNDKCYLEKPTVTKATADHEFRIHEGKTREPMSRRVRSRLPKSAL
jgi:hypothetical protein